MCISGKIEHILTISILVCDGPVSVHAQYMIRDLAVMFRIHLVEYNEQQVKTGEEGVL